MADTDHSNERMTKIDSRFTRYRKNNYGRPA